MEMVKQDNRRQLSARVNLITITHGKLYFDILYDFILLIHVSVIYLVVSLLHLIILHT